MSKRLYLNTFEIASETKSGGKWENASSTTFIINFINEWIMFNNKLIITTATN